MKKREGRRSGSKRGGEERKGKARGEEGEGSMVQINEFIPVSDHLCQTMY